MQDQQTKENRLRGLKNMRKLEVKCLCGKENTQGRYCPYGYCKGIGFLEENEELKRCLCNPKVGVEEYDNQE